MEQGTDSKAKNELLYSQFGINYNNLPARFRKGSTIVRIDPAIPESAAEGGDQSTKSKGKRKPYEGTVGELVVLHEDIIKDAFWAERPWLLA